jgi:phosphoribosyl-AMP cyclohydrolase
MDRILEEGSVTAPQFEKRGGLLPVVVQEASSDTVLMVAYTNRDAYDATRKTGYAHFWSTSRNTLWKKGETSGDVLVVEEIRLDCDQDAFLYRVRLLGEGVCHTTDSHGVHRKRCFYRTIGPEGRLQLSE